MKKNIYLIYFTYLLTYPVAAQKSLKLGANPFSIQSTSIIELETVNTGLLLPRLNNSQANGMITKAKSNNASGLTVYNTDCKCIQVFDATTTTGQWMNLTSSNTSAWTLTGNATTNPNLNFIGTTDSNDLIFKTNSIERIRLKAAGGTDFSNQTIEKFSAKITDLTTTSYTLTANDNGSVILLSNPSPITLNVPPGLPIGFNVTFYQMDNGVITLAPQAGISILQRNNVFSTAGQYAFASLLVIRSGVAVLSGDLN